MKYLILTLQAILFFWFVLVATVAADTGDEEFYSFHGHYIPLPADQDKVCLAKNIYFSYILYILKRLSGFCCFFFTLNPLLQF